MALDLSPDLEPFSEYEQLTLKLLLDIGGNLQVLTEAIGQLDATNVELVAKVTTAADAVMSLGPIITNMSGGLLGKLMGANAVKNPA